MIAESMERMSGQDLREAVAGLRGFHLPGDGSIDAADY